MRGLYSFSRPQIASVRALHGLQRARLRTQSRRHHQREAIRKDHSSVCSLLRHASCPRVLNTSVQSNSRPKTFFSQRRGRSRTSERPRHAFRAPVPASYASRGFASSQNETSVSRSDHEPMRYRNETDRVPQSPRIACRNETEVRSDYVCGRATTGRAAASLRPDPQTG